MTDDADSLLAQLRSNLHESPVSYTAASAVHDVYEGYLFSLIVEAAARCGATVTYHNAQGQEVDSLVFRTAPGRLYARPSPFTHAVIRIGSTPALEVHLGVRVRGKSRVLHECDVLLLEQSEANWSRTQRTDPRSTKYLFAVECKYYMSPLPLGMARGFVGLRADLSTEGTVFVANVGSPSVDRYLNARASGYEFEVLPERPQVGHFLSLVRNAFKTHTSTYDPGYRI